MYVNCSLLVLYSFHDMNEKNMVNRLGGKHVRRVSKFHFGSSKSPKLRGNKANQIGHGI